MEPAEAGGDGEGGNHSQDQDLVAEREELDAVTEMESPLANFNKFAVSPKKKKKKKKDMSKKKARGSMYEDGENLPAGRPPARRSVCEDGVNLPAGRPRTR